MDCERLLARCFENYYSLSETAASGILEGGQATTQIPAPALKPAVQLCSKQFKSMLDISETADIETTRCMLDVSPALGLSTF